MRVVKLCVRTFLPKILLLLSSCFVNDDNHETKNTDKQKIQRCVDWISLHSATATATAKAIH